MVDRRHGTDVPAHTGVRGADGRLHRPVSFLFSHTPNRGIDIISRQQTIDKRRQTCSSNFNRVKKTHGSARKTKEKRAQEERKEKKKENNSKNNNNRRNEGYRRVGTGRSAETGPGRVRESRKARRNRLGQWRSGRQKGRAPWWLTELARIRLLRAGDVEPHPGPSKNPPKSASAAKAGVSKVGKGGRPRGGNRLRFVFPRGQELGAVFANHPTIHGEVLVESVEPDSLAASVGLQPQMRVVRVGDMLVNSKQKLFRALEEARGGELDIQVTLRVCQHCKSDTHLSHLCGMVRDGISAQELLCRVIQPDGRRDEDTPIEGERVASAPAEAEAPDRGMASPEPERARCTHFQCPFPSCVAHTQPPQGWVCTRTPAVVPLALRAHINDHVSLEPSLGASLVESGWCREHAYWPCSECGLLVRGSRDSVHVGDCAVAKEARLRSPPVHSGPDEIALWHKWPSFVDIAAREVKLRTAVPASLRPLWARVLTHAISEVLLYTVPVPKETSAEGARCLRVWSQLGMLAKACLCHFPKAGKKHKRQGVLFTQRRLEAWLEGPESRLQLWESLPTPAGQGSRPPQNTESGRERRAAKLAADGRLSDAFRSLSDEPPVSFSQARLEQMRAKHPPPLRPPLKSSDSPRCQAWEFENEEVFTQLRKFPKGTAAGCSGLAIQHLIDAANPNCGEVALSALTNLVNLLMRGDAPAAVAESLAGARLIALPKPKGGLRPVAIGESFRRLAAKCACARAKAKVVAILAPHQLGVGVTGGGEAMVHILRQWVDRMGDSVDSVLLSLDMENAFNLVERDVFLEECRKELPEVSAFAEWCYGAPTRLLFAGNEVESRTGVQQGDPLGPLLFCLALRAFHKDVLDKGLFPEAAEDFLPLFYLDDGVMGGSQAKVSQALETIRKEGPRWGFQLNEDKCLLLPVGATDINPSWFPAAIERVSEVDILKSPIGGKKYCEGRVWEKVQKLQPGLERLAHMQDAHVAFRILTACCGAGKMMWMARTTPPHLIGEGLTEFDARIRQAFAMITGVVPTGSEWTQATLGPASGGFGLRPVALHAPAAYTASRAATFALCQGADPRFSWDSGVSGSGLSEAIACLRAGLPEGAELSAKITEHASSLVAQRSLSKALDKQRLEALLEALPLHGQARLRSCSAPHAAAWVTAPPSPALDLHLGAPQFRAAVQLWLGCPVGDPGPCARCGDLVDSHGTHLLSCKMGGSVVRRHDKLRNVVFTACKRAGLAPELEATGLLPGRLARPADVLVRRWPAGGPAVRALDLAVVSPLQRTYVRAAAASATAAATAYSDLKAERHDTEATCAGQGLTFEPLVVETYGAWSSQAQKTLTTIASLGAARSDEDKRLAVGALFQSLSLTLMRENAQAVLDRASSTRSGTLRDSAATAIHHIVTLTRHEAQEEGILEGDLPTAPCSPRSNPGLPPLSLTPSELGGPGPDAGPFGTEGPGLESLTQLAAESRESETPAQPLLFVCPRADEGGEQMTTY